MFKIIIFLTALGLLVLLTFGILGVLDPESKIVKRATKKFLNWK